MTVIVGLLIGACIGWLACRIHHHAAIRDAGVERIHERKITALRVRESDLTAQLRAKAKWN